MIITGTRLGAAVAALSAALGGCGGETAGRGAAPPAAVATRDSAASIPGPAGNASQSAVADIPAVLCLGTSLTAGYGLEPDQAYPALLQQRIDAAGLRFRVVNAGVSGETSAGALRRMDWLLRQPVAVLLVETGANDMLRGQDVAATRANVDGILARARRQVPPPRLLVLGMQAATNLGAPYGRAFRAIFPELARAHGAALVPFVLEGVAGFPDLNQADGVHPTPAGHRRMADTVWRVLEPILREVAARETDR